MMIRLTLMKSGRAKGIFLTIWLVAVLLTGCEREPLPESPLYPLKPDEYPVFADDLDFTGVSGGIAQSLIYLNRVPPDRQFMFDQETVSASHMIESLETFDAFLKTNPSSAELNRFIRKRYAVYRSRGRPQSGKVLFTGYYAPLLRGSLKQSESFTIPVFSRPKDMVVADLSRFSERFEGERIVGRVMGNSFVPYHDRREIEHDGVLTGKAEPVAWLQNRIDLFFLQVQGSGKVELEDGSRINVHYQAQNGRPYRSIGKLLIDTGRIPVEEMSMQRIREYLELNPGEIDEVLNYNPSYIFFSVEDKGPLGALNTPLTPERSIAVDRKIFPLATLAYARTHKPVIDRDRRIKKWLECSRFVLTQDTGGAIKGPGRADLFWGAGEYAEIAAGHMKHNGDLYCLILKK